MWHLLLTPSGIFFYVCIGLLVSAITRAMAGAETEEEKTKRLKEKGEPTKMPVWLLLLIAGGWPGVLGLIILTLGIMAVFEIFKKIKQGLTYQI